MAIVYFDGHCNVCNKFVDFLIRNDKKRVLKFSPLQGVTAKSHLPPELVNDLSTMALEEDGVGGGAPGASAGGGGGKISTDSSAAIKTIAYLGGVYSLMSVFLLVPKFLRDFVYRWIANHRYLFAGRSKTCRLPTAEERTQFLD